MASCQEAAHKVSKGEVSTAVHTFVDVASTSNAREDGTKRGQAAFTMAHERTCSIIPADSPACSFFWQAVALWGTHERHYKQDWEAFTAAHQAPSVVQHVVTTKVRDLGARWRPLRNILTIQRAWGSDSYLRLSAVAHFPRTPTQNLLEQLAKLSGLQQLADVEGQFAPFLDTYVARHHNRAAFEKKIHAGTFAVTARHVEVFIQKV